MSPNPYYYLGSFKPTEHKGSPTLAEFGRKHNIPCGGHWIIGDDFVFLIEFPVCSYSSPLTKVLEFNKYNTQYWYEFRLELERYKHIWICKKDRDQVAKMLDIDTERLL